MKITAILLLFAGLTVSAKGVAQITLSEKNVSLTSVFKKIQQQSGYQFLYPTDLIQDVGTVSVQVNNVSLEDAVKAALAGTKLTFAISEKTVVIRAVITPTEEEKNLPPPPIDVTGRITNEQGEPLSGASVIIKRTGRGDIADAQGDFHLKDVTNDDYLIISFAGYKTQTIKVGSITKFTIVMQVTDNDLDKVVIQAYGTTTQRLATGDIATVKAEQIERQPVMNALAALEGQVPGLVITQNNGYASAPFRVELRGRSVINPDLPSEPLYIIDGVPLSVLNLGNDGNYASGSYGFTQNGLTGPAGGQSPLFSINPEDIESITVLKDADATAIYGSRGANGVIIITTKKGTAGKTKFNVNVYSGTSEVPFHYSMLNTQQYLEMRREAFKNDNVAMTASNAYDVLVWDTTRNTDWQKVLWSGQARTIDVESSLSGGDKQTTFRIGGNYHRETNILTLSGSDQRSSIQFNLSHKSLNEKLKTSFSSTYSYIQSDLNNVPNIVKLPPDAPSIFDAEGHLNYSGWAPVQNNYPFASLLQPYTVKTDYLNSQLMLQYQLLRGLNVSTDLGYSRFHNSQEGLIPIASQNPARNPLGAARFGNNNGNNYIVEPQIKYQRLFNKGKFDILIGGSIQSVSQDGNLIIASGYVNDNMIHSAASAPTTSASNSFAQYKYAALFSRLNYNWDDRYIVNLSARRDGSSRFGPGKQFSNFGSVGLAWIFTKEEWVKKHLSFLSFGKLRGSYGLTGSDQILNYQYLSQWTAYSVPYGGNASYVSSILPNPDLVWQSNYKLEGALDLGFLNDRLTFEIVRYRNRCGNQLVPFTLPSTTGFNSITANFPAVVQNSGWESSIKWKFIDRGYLTWSAYFNIGINRNKLISYPNLSQSPYASIYTVGESLNIKRLLHYTGVDPLTGQYSFLDKNHDGVITTSYNNGINDLFEKDLSVKFDGSVGSDFRYKGLQLDVLFTFRKQQLPSAIFSGGYPGNIVNQSTVVLNHWKYPGDVSIFARYSTTSTTSDVNFIGRSDGIYVDGSYVRLRNLSISFDLPNSWIKKAFLQNARIYFSGENLFLWTKYDGDPTTPVLGEMPILKTFAGGIKFNF